MNTVVINIGGTDCSIQYYFDIDNDLIIDSIQDFEGFEVTGLLSDETFKEIEQIIL